MPKTPQTAEKVTDNPIVTDYDGLPEFDWRSFFVRTNPQKPVTNRHPSLITDRERMKAARDFAAGQITVDQLAAVLAADGPAGLVQRERPEPRPRFMPPMPPLAELQRDPYWCRARAQILPSVARGVKSEELDALAYRIARHRMQLPIEEALPDSDNRNLGAPTTTGSHRTNQNPTEGKQ